MYYIIYTLRFFYIYSIIAITLRLIQSTFLIVLSIHHLTMAYNFHTNSKHSESTLFKNSLSCIKLPTVSSLSSKVKEMAHVAHERQGRSENIGREDWSHSILASHDLHLTACILLINCLEKIKRLFALYCSTCWQTLYRELQKPQAAQT